MGDTSGSIFEKFVSAYNKDKLQHIPCLFEVQSQFALIKMIYRIVINMTLPSSLSRTILISLRLRMKYNLNVTIIIRPYSACVSCIYSFFYMSSNRVEKGLNILRLRISHLVHYTI